MSEEKLLEIKDLSVAFRKNQVTTSVFSGLSFDIYQGETVCLVGESGSGKSVTAKAIMRLLPTDLVSYPEGEIRFNGQDLLSHSEREMEQIRGDQIAMVFQDALSALNPVYTIGTQMVDLIRLHAKEKLSRRQALAQAKKLLAQVDIRHADEVVKQYPFQLSGGMRQRVMIAMALSSRPRLLIADEPTTALDVTVQSNILKLIRQLKEQFGMTILFITHDLGVVYEMADRVLVLRQGELVESGTRDEIFTRPRHAYTKQLLNSMPRIYFQEQTELP
ncbi:ABC-type dipeptide/oligopeptide/nickel transport system ATPase component [Fontibacillus solani]|uniref:ABC-type dipeptide/oligopeptide/nickel transport system ATPase component n=1 Tax=Fontibacillus solani TaxID=1572857 RepID=A0A7W3SYP0_9BACL|nr:ABC transporter ATP-binding protein [Fontibacillus solani]MBA9088373.1 ABC-type dipeptide/oligopeptide/nickel transport system ATPase component [Fontibacillus solani]